MHVILKINHRRVDIGNAKSMGCFVLIHQINSTTSPHLNSKKYQVVSKHQEKTISFEIMSTFYSSLFLPAAKRLGHGKVWFFQKGTIVKKGNCCFLVDCSFIICLVSNSNLTCKFCLQILLANFTCKFYLQILLVFKILKKKLEFSEIFF